MQYLNTRYGNFLARPNRFIALVDLDGTIARCHVKNTGRCAELLVPDAKVILEKANHPGRATAYSLIAVWKGERLINMDSAAPNKAFGEYLKQGGYLAGLTQIKPEASYGSARFDFFCRKGDRGIYIEVKGVTLEEEGVVLFPDAPTERGVKHLKALIHATKAGFDAHAVFVVQMKGVRYFTPNSRTHPAFAQALREAKDAGVTLSAFDCHVTEDSMTIGNPVPILLP